MFEALLRTETSFPMLKRRQRWLARWLLLLGSSACDACDAHVLGLRTLCLMSRRLRLAYRRFAVQKCKVSAVRWELKPGEETLFSSGVCASFIASTTSVDHKVGCLKLLLRDFGRRGTEPKRKGAAVRARASASFCLGASLQELCGSPISRAAHVVVKLGFLEVFALSFGVVF